MVVVSRIAVVRCPAGARRTGGAMPPMWSAPVAGDGRLRAGRWGRWVCAGAAVGARRAAGAGSVGGGDGVGVVARSGRPGDLAGVPGPLGGDAPGWAGVGALGVAGCGRSGRPVSPGARRLSRPGAVGPGGGAGCGRGARCRPWVVGLQGLWRRGGVRRPGSARAPAGRGGDSAPAGARGRAVVGRAGAGARPGPAAPPCRRRRWPPGRPRRQGPWRPSCRRALIGPRPRSRAPPEPRAHRGPGREPDRAGGSGRHRARRDRGPPAAAGPSPRRAPAQDAGASLRQMPRPAPTPRGASSGHRAIARRTRGPAPRLLSGPTPQSQTTSVTTRTRRTVTHALRHHTATGPAEGGHDEHPYDLAARPATPDAPGVEAPVLVRKVQCEELGGSEQS